MKKSVKYVLCFQKLVPLYICAWVCERERALNYQLVSRPVSARAQTVGSRARAAPVARPAGAGCTWRSGSSWRAESSRSPRSAAW